jgi:hypothetical protein
MPATPWSEEFGGRAGGWLGGDRRAERRRDVARPVAAPSRSGPPGCGAPSRYDSEGLRNKPSKAAPEPGSTAPAGSATSTRAARRCQMMTASLCGRGCLPPVSRVPISPSTPCQPRSPAPIRVDGVTSAISTKSRSVHAWRLVVCVSWSNGLPGRLGDRVSATWWDGLTIRGLHHEAMSPWTPGLGGDRLRALAAASGVRQEDQIRLGDLLTGMLRVPTGGWGRCRRCRRRPNRP